jgi:Flp pilus assembly protein TadG
VTWNPAGTAIAIAHATSPYVTAYPWSSGFGTKYANPATLPTGTGRGVAFNADGSNIAIAHATTPFVTAYPFSSGFGTKYANPVTLPTGDAYGVAFI